MNDKILITGAAGFIGFHLSKFLLDKGFQVIGIDNLNTYYDVNLKRDRLSILEQRINFTFCKIDLNHKKLLDEIFQNYSPKYVINLAAQAGVRYSINNPYAYVDSNIVGFINILEACRHHSVKHLIYASSSSVYGGNKTVPFSTSQNVDHPISLYAATKKSNELMAYVYSYLYKIPTTGLRFFTVYGPWGRPDMAYFVFTKNIVDSIPIKVFNFGEMERDFTYIDDVVESIYKLIPLTPTIFMEQKRDANDLCENYIPYKIYNIGNSKPVQLMNFISAIEEKLGKKAEKNYVDKQPGDILRTYADVSELEMDINFKPKTSIDEGIEKFVEWYKEYYKVRL